MDFSFLFFKVTWPAVLVIFMYHNVFRLHTITNFIIKYTKSFLNARIYLSNLVFEELFLLKFRNVLPLESLKATQIFTAFSMQAHEIGLKLQSSK